MPSPVRSLRARRHLLFRNAAEVVEFGIILHVRQFVWCKTREQRERWERRLVRLSDFSAHVNSVFMERRIARAKETA